MSSIKRLFTRRRESGIILGLAILIAFFAIFTESFFSVDNLFNITRQVSLNGIMAVGMTIVIMLGYTDLSLGSIYYFSCVTCAQLMTTGYSIIVSAIIGIVCGVLCGLANGIMISYLRLPAFISTLGMKYIIRGLGRILSGGFVISLTERLVPDLKSFTFIGNGRLLGETLPVLALFLFGVFIIGYFIIHKSLYGFRLKASGGNPNAAWVAGISVKKITIIAYSLNGLFAGLAGVLCLAWLSSVQSGMGEDIALEVIAASVIGGTSVAGGEGSIVGTFVGVLIMGILKNGLVFMGVTPFLQMVMVGVVIIISVSIDMWTSKR